MVSKKRTITEVPAESRLGNRGAHRVITLTGAAVGTVLLAHINYVTAALGLTDPQSARSADWGVGGLVGGFGGAVIGWQGARRSFRGVGFHLAAFLSGFMLYAGFMLLVSVLAHSRRLAAVGNVAQFGVVVGALFTAVAFITGRIAAYFNFAASSDLPPSKSARSTGFSLTEVLVALAVLAVLAALLFPALSAARSRAQLTVCMSNMHQIGIALEMYHDDWIEYPLPNYLSMLALHGYLDPRLLVCPSDPWKDYSREASFFFQPVPENVFPTTYLNGIGPYTQWQRLNVVSQLTNLGLAACVVHGTQFPEWRGVFFGPYLRVTVEGAVVRRSRPEPRVCSDPFGTSWYLGGQPFYALFVDLPYPPVFEQLYPEPPCEAVASPALGERTQFRN